MLLQEDIFKLIVLMKNKNKYSRIIAGTMTWGSWGKNFVKEEIISLMQHCLAVGVTTFDHADIYGHFTNEEAFGTAFKASGISRENIQLISKCGIQHVCDNRTTRVKHYNYSKAHIISSVETSLKNLNTSYLDLFLLHRPSPLMQPEEVAEAVFLLRKEGKIQEFGVSNFNPSQIALIETAIPVEANQVEFSLTTEEAMHNGILDDALAHKRLAMAWSPLGTYFREDNEKTKRIKEIAAGLLEKYNIEISQLLLAWSLQHPAKIHPVVGTGNPARLKQAIQASKVTLELEDWFALLEASQGNEVP